MPESPLLDTRSIWLKTSIEPQFPAVEPGARFDVAILGGGIVGVLLAHELRNSGLSVAIIEAQKVLQGVTGYTTAKLTSQHGFVYQSVREGGVEAVRAYYEANEWAINDIRDYARTCQIDCGMTTDNAHVVVRERQNEAHFQKEIEVLREAEIPHEAFAGPDARHGGIAILRFGNQAYFHPRRYLLAILKECHEAGVKIFENSRIIEMEQGTPECVLTLANGKITADKVVVATHYPIYDSNLFVTKLAPYRSYAIAVTLEEPVPPGMFITYESENSRSARAGNIDGNPFLIIGGANHKVGQEDETADRYAEIEDYARTRYQVRDVLARWSTQDNWTPDKRAFIGHSPGRENIFMATGFNGWGMTTGRVAANILAAQIQGQEHKWASLYTPDRFHASMLGGLISENFNVAKQLVGGKVAPADQRRPHDLNVGEAAILAGNPGKLAAFRDHNGEVFCVSADCTHLGCTVAWNEAERTWDCPCHGSRFKPSGEVIHGPATKPLAPKSV